jgi:heterodisulfide reductase subunit B
MTPEKVLQAPEKSLDEKKKSGEVAYYPGCTLKTTARGLETSALAAAEALGLKLVELDRWNCCGTVHSLATDNIMNNLAAARNLVRARENGFDKFVTLCSICYNTQKSVNMIFKEDDEKKEKINAFMYEEPDYEGDVEVLHLLELIRDDVGFDKVRAKVSKPLSALKIVPYYGCLLLRPRAVAFDSQENPSIMENLLEATGAVVVDDPYKTECCGTYHTVSNVDLVVEHVYRILRSVQQRGADAITTTCPLCQFNLDRRQKEVGEKYADYKPLPSFYFTQLLCIALGLGEEPCRFDLHHIDPRPLLKEKGLL